MLAPYAVHPEGSLGRRHPEPEHPYRSAFQRDRDRVIHSRAFRRLESKTQVFTRRYSDHFRNRLTHTIEVAQISRTVAGELGLNVDLAETLALAHDIGHPPFGHAGEQELDACMREHGERFDHNLHALRIVEHFEQRYAGFRGLNLSFEVREGIIKHSRDYDAATAPQLAEYRLDQRPPLEAQLIDLTDEIAYNTADLDDGLESGFITLEQVRQGVGLLDSFYREADQRFPAALEKLKFNEALKRMLDALAGDLIAHTRARVEAAGVRSLEDVRRHPERLAAFGPPIEAARRECKQFLYDNLYYCDELKADKQRGQRIVREMFTYWMADPAKLPHSYQEQVSAGTSSLARVVCDYIAGMTDTFIAEQHRTAFGV
jgi:dGTPase